MRLLTRDKSFYKQLLFLAIPIAMQNLINFSVAMADTLMLGILGETPLAAANLANKFSNIFMLFVFGLAGGTNVIVAQCWGKKDVSGIKETLTIAYRVLIVGAIFFSFVSIFFPAQIMQFFTKDTLVQQEGIEYLRILGFSHLFAGFSSVTLMVLRSVGTVKIALGVYLTSLVTNVCVNGILIFGLFGAPALGMRGAALGTLTARLVETAIVLVFLAKYERKIHYTLQDFFKKGSSNVKHFGAIASPVIINEIVWSIGSAFLSVIIGHMGTPFTAADSVCTILSQLVTVFIWGVGHASAALIGNTIGAGKRELAREYARTLQVLSVGLGLLSSVVVLLVRDPMISIFRISDLAKEYAREIITVYAFIVVFQAVSAVCLIGILRGAGNTRFVLFMDIIFMWIVCIPLGYIVGLKLPVAVPVGVVYAILRSDEIFKAIAATLKLSKDNWIQNVVSAPIAKES